MNSFDGIVGENADSVCASGEAIVTATGHSCPKVGGEVRLLPLTLIVLDPNQPRKTKGDLEQMKQSLQTHDLIHPIVVRPLANGKYCIVTGERRYLAALALGWSEILVIVWDITPQKSFDLQRAENRDRKDFTPFEIGEVFWKMKTEKGMTQTEIGEEDGLSQSEVSEYMKLRSLPPHLKASYDSLPLENHPLTLSHLFELARMTPGEEQDAAWEEAKNGDLTVLSLKTIRQSQKSQAKNSVPSGVGSVRAVPKQKTLTAQVPDSATIQTPDVDVVLQSRKGILTLARKKAALEFALDKVDADIDALSSGAQTASDPAEDSTQSSTLPAPQPSVQAMPPDTAADAHDSLPESWEEEDISVTTEEAESGEDPVLSENMKESLLNSMKAMLPDEQEDTTCEDDDIPHPSTHTTKKSDWIFIPDDDDDDPIPLLRNSIVDRACPAMCILPDEDYEEWEPIFPLTEIPDTEEDL